MKPTSMGAIVALLIVLISCAPIQAPSTQPATQPEISTKEESSKQEPDLPKTSKPDATTPEDFMAQIEAMKDNYESQPVEECLPEQSPVRISFTFEKDLVTDKLTRLHITDMVFEGYDYKANYYEFVNCRSGGSKGENVNYLYCGDFMPIDVNFVDNSGVIVDTVGLSFVFDKSNNKWVDVTCLP